MENETNNDDHLISKIKELVEERDFLSRSLQNSKDEARHLYEQNEMKRVEIRELGLRIDDLETALSTIAIEYASRLAASRDSLMEIRISNARREAREDFDAENAIL